MLLVTLALATRRSRRRSGRRAPGVRGRSSRRGGAARRSAAERLLSQPTTGPRSAEVGGELCPLTGGRRRRRRRLAGRDSRARLTYDADLGIYKRVCCARRAASNLIWTQWRGRALQTTTSGAANAAEPSRDVVVEGASGAPPTAGTAGRRTLWHTTTSPRCSTEWRTCPRVSSSRLTRASTRS